MVFTVKAVRKKGPALKGVKVGSGTKVKVGFPVGKTDQLNINKAIWNEFGTSGGGWGGPIPERPFFRTAMRRNKAKYRAALRTSASKLLLGTTDLDTVLNKLGIQAQQDVQASITGWTTPPNSPVTIALKGSSHPLIDTGEMRRAVTWKIEP